MHRIKSGARAQSLACLAAPIQSRDRQGAMRFGQQEDYH
jgi:hypothetical protein